MSQYKVPQDVEAEDKLIGWLSFRQLIYAGIAFGSVALCFFSFQVFPALALIPLPFAILFTVLTLPLRKDQPLETYLLAVARFYLKSKIRRWDPDGVETYVEITAPKKEEKELTKEYGAEGAQERLDYLSKIMDSRGWAYKKLGSSPYDNNLNADIAAEATNAVDVMDEHTNVAQSFNSLIKQRDVERRQNAIEKMQQITARMSEHAEIKDVRSSDAPGASPTYNPYPSSMHQKVVQPSDPQDSHQQAANDQPTSPVTPQVTPAIMDLANSSNLSVSTIASEAKRLQDKEVVIKLR
jgi:hypothetical protein